MSFSVWIDGIWFGNKFSSLNALLTAKPDVVWLDPFLSKDISINKPKQVFLDEYVSLCKELNIILIADGISTKEDLDCVKSLGVKYANGDFFLSKNN